MSTPVSFNFVLVENPSDARITWNERNEEVSPEIHNVHVKVRDLEAWKQCGYPTSIIISGKTSFVTSRLTSAQIDKVRNLPFVISCELGRYLHPS